jgi:single-strand DNA-binding protein
MGETKTGQHVTTVRVATSRYIGKGDEKREETEWHSVVLWNEQAKYACEYLRKGALVVAEGRLQTRKWTDKDGNDRYTTEIVAHRFQGLDRRTEAAAPAKDKPKWIDREIVHPGADIPF